MSENKNRNMISDFLSNLVSLPISAFRSVFRHPFPRDDLGRAYTMFSNFFLHFFPVKSHKNSLKVTYTFGLGIMSLFLFIILTITGVVLMFYYIPSTDRAYQRMKDLEFVISYGKILRNMHRWAAHGMVITVLLHMCRVFYTGSYKHPREMNWVIGVILLVLTLGLSFTGYLLPWDQLAFWAVTVGSSIAGYAPVIGDLTKFVLLGGNIVGQEALIRFYVLHVILLPIIALILIALHMWRIRKDGGLSRPAYYRGGEETS